MRRTQRHVALELGLVELEVPEARADYYAPERMPDHAYCEVFKLFCVYVVFYLYGQAMPAFLNNTLSHTLIGFGNQKIAIRIPPLQVHPNILHIKARSLEPMYKHNKPILLSGHRFIQHLHIFACESNLGAMLLNAAEFGRLGFLLQYLFYLLVVVGQLYAVKPVVFLQAFLVFLLQRCCVRALWVLFY